MSFNTNETDRLLFDVLKIFSYTQVYPDDAAPFATHGGSVLGNPQT